MNAVLNRKFWALIKQHGINPDQKDGLVLEFTGDRTHHSGEMSDHEANMLIRHLGMCFQPRDIDGGACDKLRKRLIAMSYSICEDTVFVKGWAEKHGVGAGDNRIKRKFNDYSANELVALIAKFKKVVSDRENR